MSRILAKKIGLGVGISSGANFIASALTKGKDIVTIFPDDFKKYLSTDLTKEIDKDERLISNQIEILEIKKV
jgi:cysteine synthase A